DSAIITLDAYPRSEPYFSRQFGPRVPLYCTALGKALLAFFEKHELNDYLERVELIAYTPNTITKRDKLLKDLEETRQRGYSINREEHLLARAAIGAPIFGREGNPVAAMSLVIDPTQIIGEPLDRMAKEVINTSMEISRYLGYFPEVASASGRMGE
ncbi:MAG: IclR family transcriptional regulator C-terminal domain-containing protein, partial [Pseudomonadota bacterium]